MHAGGTSWQTMERVIYLSLSLSLAQGAGEPASRAIMRPGQPAGNGSNSLRSINNREDQRPEGEGGGAARGSCSLATAARHSLLGENFFQSSGGGFWIDFIA